MKQSSNMLLALCAGVIWSMSAQAAGHVEIKWGAGGTFIHSTSIPAGKFVEVCGRLLKDERVGWAFTADKVTNFNIHYHVGDKVEFPEKRDGVARLNAELSVPGDQDYCWMWTNKHDAPVALELSLIRR